MIKKMTLAMVVWMMFSILTTAPLPYYAAENETVAGTKGFLHAFYPSTLSYTPAVEAYIKQLDAVSFAWSRLDYADKPVLNMQKGENGNFGFYFPEDYLLPLRTAKSAGIPVMLNLFASKDTAVRILPFAEQRTAAIQSILETLSKDMGNGEMLYFDGIVIDFEGLQNTALDGTDVLYEGGKISAHFNVFLQELKMALDAAGKKMYVAVNTRNYYDGYDYKEILALSDKTILMAHDYEPSGVLKKYEAEQFMKINSLSPINAPAPKNKVKRALQDIKDSAADETQLKKVILQIAFDAAQWQFDLIGPDAWDDLNEETLSKGERSTPTYAMIKNRVDNMDGSGIDIAAGYNNELQSAYMHYFNAANSTYNIIVFEDQKSILEKIKAAEWYGLGGISLWSLGNVPDYNDANGTAYHLDGWNSLVKNISENSHWGADSLTAVNRKGTGIKFENKQIEATVREKLGRPIGEIFAEDLTDIYRLKITTDNGGIKDLKYFTNLEYLDASACSISDVTPLSTLKNLKVLYLQKNKIAGIKPLSSLTNLQILSLNGNVVTDISPLKGCTALKELYLKDNKITTVAAVSVLKNLQVLYLSNNKITDFKPLAKQTGLMELGLEDSKIKDIAFLGQLKNLRFANLSGNLINQLDVFKNLKNLKTLYLQRNKINNITVLSSLKSLEVLSLNGNQISSVKGLQGLTNLRQLYLRDNKLADIQSLSSLLNLKTLFLKGNIIKDYTSVQPYYGNLTEKDFTLAIQ